MSKVSKIAIVVVLIVLVVTVIVLKRHNSRREDALTGDAETTQQQVVAFSPEQLTGQGRPTLIDLGAGTCIPCKLMTPILENLKAEYAGTLDVHFLDVHENQDLIPLYKINVIPTQIFYDASGRELFRHEGFFAKEDILAKWKELGIDLSEGTLRRNEGT